MVCICDVSLLLMQSLFMFTTQAGFAAGLPVIHISGTHYQVGYQVGKVFRDMIQDYLASYKDFQNTIYPFVQTARGARIYRDYVDIINGSYPQYVEEMQGTADGANLTFKQVAVLNLRVELSALLDLQLPPGCSDVFIDYYPYTGVIGHNEDCSPIIKGRAYMVSAVIYNTNPRGRLTVPVENFTAYTYPGALPGNAFGFTGGGLVMTINALYPKLVQLKGTPRQVITRALLSAQSAKDLKTIIENKGVGTAFGFSLNVGSTEYTNLMYNYEVAPSDSQPQSLLDILTIDMKMSTHQHQDQSRRVVKNTYFHVNHYRRLKVKERSADIISSLHRARTIQSLFPPKTTEDILRILGDTSDSLYPIYRHPTPADPAVTAATGMFDLWQRTLTVYLANPKTGQPSRTFNLPLPRANHP